MSDAIDRLDLARLTHETFVERLHYFEEIASTNTTALQHARSASEPLTELFLAERQTDGRGRGNNQWWSAPGSLTWSVLTRPLNCPPKRLPQVSLTMGLAICEAVEKHVQADVTLKWPNDVFLNGRKVAGILIELAGSAEARLVIGVGLNVNNSVQNAPAALQTIASSMVDASSGPAKVLDRTAVLEQCLLEIERHLQRFVDSDPKLPDDWRARSLLTGRRVQVEGPRSAKVGVCEGIAEDGALLVRTDEGVEPCYGGVVASFD